ncbi:MAG TPA: hypothetical protein GXX19_04530, partial [Syntrophomonadaceae bacterium]|nr:hypothetical protein [Syntrophomonadaceae bacterium]
MSWLRARASSTGAREQAQDKPKRISRADHHAASGGTNRGTKKRFILAGAATYGGCYSPLTKEQLTAAEA